MSRNVQIARPNARRRHMIPLWLALPIVFLVAPLVGVGLAAISAVLGVHELVAQVVR